MRAVSVWSLLAMGRNKNERFENCRINNWAWKILIALRPRGNRKKAVGERVFCAGFKLEKEDVDKFCGDRDEFHAPSNGLFAVGETDHGHGSKRL